MRSEEFTTKNIHKTTGLTIYLAFNNILRYHMNMIKVLFPLPKTLTVAFSGGVDSVAIVDFLSKKHDVTCAFFHHGTENSDNAFKFVAQFCADRHLPMLVGTIRQKQKRGLSLEEHWRNERYQFLSTLGPVVTGHHLDDCVETYLWSCMHGTPKVIPMTRNNVIRPFLTTPKKEFIDWCIRKKLEWCHDTSNDDVKYMRNYVRKHLIPHALTINPGLHKVVKRLVENNSYATSLDNHKV
jgi:tRNA(Ile)-lysidine synthase